MKSLLFGSIGSLVECSEIQRKAFNEAFKDRKFNGHLCRVSEGNYGGFFGWPNLTLTPKKKFMGINATPKSSEMRAIDMYRREGKKLTENWVFIDLLHFWKILGIDILKNLK